MAGAFQSNAFQNSAFQTGSSSTSAPAGVATGTGVAYGVSRITNAEAPSGTGTSGGAAGSVGVATQSTSGSASALDATTTSDSTGTATPSVATGTGVAAGASSSVEATAGLASGTGASADAAGHARAVAGVAAGAGAVLAQSSLVSSPIGVATGTGAAHDATATAVNAGYAELASGSGSSNGASKLVGVSAGSPAGTGLAQTPQTKVSARPTTAIGTGQANQAYVSAGSPRAGVATGAGAVGVPRGRPSSTAGLAVATGAAYGALPVSGLIPGVATGSGSAHNASVITIITYANAGVASGIGAAYPARTGGGQAFTEPAEGSGSAHNTLSPVELRRTPLLAQTITDPTRVVVASGDLRLFEEFSGEFGFVRFRYAGYVRLVLSVPTNLKIDTFGSGIYDTYLYVFQEPLTDAYNTYSSWDDNNTPTFWDWNWSAAPYNLEDVAITYPAGTYMLVITPYSYYFDPSDDPRAQITIEVEGSKAAHPFWDSYSYYNNVDGIYPALTMGMGQAWAPTVVSTGNSTGNASTDVATGTGLARNASIYKTLAVVSGTGAAHDATTATPAARAMAGVSTGVGAAHRVYFPVLTTETFGDTPALAGEVFDPIDGFVQVSGNLSGFNSTLSQQYGATPTIVTQVSDAGYQYSAQFARPATALPGDTLVVILGLFSRFNQVVNITVYGGSFTQVRRDSSGNDSPSTQIWTRTVGPLVSESSYYTFNFGGPAIYFGAWLGVIRSPSGPMTIATGGAVGTSYVYSHTTTSLTAPSGNSVLLLGWPSVYGSGFTPGWSTPAGMTELLDTNPPSPNSYGGLAVHRQVVASPGSIGTKTSVSNMNEKTIYSYIWLSPPIASLVAYTGWIELVLLTDGLMAFDTFGSGMADTVLAVYSDPPPAEAGDGSFLYFNDNTSTSTVSQPLWSSIPADLAGNATVSLPAGTYWIAVWPKNGVSSNGNYNVILNVRRIGGPVLVVVPPRNSPVRMIFEHLGDVAPLVVWSKVELETALGADGSLGTIVVRDVGIVRDVFQVGQRITVDLGPGTRPIWSGYLWRAARRFWFPADEPDTIQRQWRLAVIDINILFRARVAYNQASPATIKGPKYVASTYDDTVISTLVNDWLDLSADDLDVTTKVDRVGLINYGEVTYPINGGQTFGEAMKEISRLPAAAYGINPSRELVYADVDDRNVPFFLSDETGYNTVGYRECLIIFDGSGLMTEVFAWGAGRGSDEMVFHRRSSASAITEHGLWQEGILSYGIWKQATVEKVTDSALNGSPSSHRGHKDDRVEVRVMTHEHGIVVGDRVRFISNIWNYEDVIPVRRVRLTFPTANDVRYELRLSHEIDQWNFQDPVPPIADRGTPPLDPTPEIDIKIKIPCISVGFLNAPFPGSSTGLVTGPFTSGIWSGNWQLWPSSPSGSSSDNYNFDSSTLDGTWTIANSPAGYGTRLIYTGSAPWNRNVVTGRFRFQFSRVPVSPTYALELVYGAATVRVSPADTAGELRLTTAGGATATSIPSVLANQWYVADISLDLLNNTTRVQFWKELTPGSITVINQLANFERVGDGVYQPFLGIHMRNPETFPVTLTMDLNGLRSFAYSDATSTSLSMGWASPSTAGWGGDWVTYGAQTLNDISPGIDPNISYESNGVTATMTSTGTTNGWIQRPINGESAIDLAFSVLVEGPGGLPEFHFYLWPPPGNRLNVRRIKVTFPNTVSVTLTGTGTGFTNTVLPAGLFTVKTNVRIAVHGAGVQVRFWLPGTPEPTAWSAENLSTQGVVSPWPGDNMVWGIKPTSFKVTIGPLSDYGEVFLKTAKSFELVTTGVQTLTAPVSTNQTWGPYGTVDFGYPNDGREYAVAWGAPNGTFVSSLTNSPGGPEHYGTMQWSLFDDGGPGAPRHLDQRVAGTNLPVYYYEEGGIEIPVKVVVRGEITATIGGGNGPFGGGPYPGALSQKDVVIDIKGFTRGPVNPGLPVILGTGETSTIFGYTRTTVGVLALLNSQNWQPFSAVFELGQGVDRYLDGTTHLAWGVEIRDLMTHLHEIGGYYQNFFPSGTRLDVNLRNVTYELALDPDYSYPAQIDPCTGETLFGTPTVPGLTDGSAARVSSTVYRTPDPYRLSTLQVWLNGRAMRWLIDFTETDPGTGLFTFTMSVLVTDEVTTRYNLELT